MGSPDDNPLSRITIPISWSWATAANPVSGAGTTLQSAAVVKAMRVENGSTISSSLWECATVHRYVLSSWRRNLVRQDRQQDVDFPNIRTRIAVRAGHDRFLRIGANRGDGVEFGD